MSKTFYKKAFATGVLASTAIVSSSLGTFANAQENPDTNQNAAQRLAACIQGSKSADILLVIDETGSLVGKGSNPQATDAEGKRVDAAMNFAREMARYADDNKAAINIKLGGFADDYLPHGGWQKLAIDGNGTNVDRDIEAFKDRTDGEYTDYAKGLDGAAEAVSDGTSDCKAILFFSDGFPTREAGGAEAVMQDVCRPEGAVGRLRAADTLIFTVGLAPEKSATDTPDLRRISEGDCSDSAPSGQHLFANNPGELMAAFRQMVPDGGSVEAERGLTEKQDFTLDNSIDNVRISAQPDSAVEGADKLTPVLTGPDGQEVELKPGAQTVAGNEVNVVENANVPGGYDIDLAKGGDEWAGQWNFGYKPQESSEGKYHVKMTIEPGLSIAVDGSDDSPALSLKSDQPLAVSLLNKEGQQHGLEGTADLAAEIVGEDGTTVPLGNHDIHTGRVEIPLQDIDDAVRGTLRLSATIATKPSGDGPGTQLKPIVYEKPISVVPANAPNIPGSAILNMKGTEGSFEIPVTGPGEVWIEPGAIDTNGTQINYSANHDSASPLKLGKGETGKILVTTKVDKAVDAPINGASVPVAFKDADGKEGSPAQVAVNGSVNAPVNKVVFGTTLVIVLLLGLLIPIGLLYLIRFLTGKIPTNPGLHVLRIPVSARDSQLLRQDTGREFDVDYQNDFINAVRTKSTGKSLDAAGLPIKVRTGWNPLAPVQAVVDAEASVSDDGKQVGRRASLPLAVHNRWFAYVDQNNPADQAIILLCDESMSPEHLATVVEEIQSKGASRITKLAQQVGEQGAPSSSTGGAPGAAASGFATAPGASAAPEQNNGGWGQTPAPETPSHQDSGWGVPANGASNGPDTGFGWGQADGQVSDNSDDTSTQAWGAVGDSGNNSASGGWDQTSGGGWSDSGWGTDQQDNNGGFNR